MVEMLVLADDVTGALDTGVKFSAAGLRTKIALDYDRSLSNENADILVLCIPTRHIDVEKAYTIIREVAKRAAQNKIKYIFKKTDSALRGNIGAELNAVLDGSGAKELVFIPALPAMNRLTRDGIHYIDGVPVHESVFGRDPFAPVTESHVPSLIRSQVGENVQVVSCLDLDSTQNTSLKQITVMDCTGQDDLDRTVRRLWGADRLYVAAGCSGLAEAMAGILKKETSRLSKTDLSQKLLVICGSVNPISQEQIEHAVAKGFARIHLPAEHLLQHGGIDGVEGQRLLASIQQQLGASDVLLIDTVPMEQRADPWDRLRQDVASIIGDLLKRILDGGVRARLMIIGGDTLLGFMNAIGCTELIPGQEPFPGVVTSQLSYKGQTYEVLSKSGGFGDRELLLEIGLQSKKI